MEKSPSMYQQIKISINLFAYTYIGILGKVSKEKLSNINRSHLHHAQPNNKMNQWTNGPNINRDHLHQAQPEQMETTFQSTNTIRDLSRGLWPSYFHGLEYIFYPAIYTSQNFLCKSLTWQAMQGFVSLFLLQLLMVLSPNIWPCLTYFHIWSGIWPTHHQWHPFSRFWRWPPLQF